MARFNFLSYCCQIHFGMDDAGKHTAKGEDHVWNSKAKKRKLLPKYLSCG